jgi:CheY-like chemotaxis protein
LSLTGNLEDLPLLDIIQIVSFSKKTGALSIRTEEGEAGIAFHEGLVVCAFASDTAPIDRRFGALPAAQRDVVIRSRIELALEQLIRLRDGQFSFNLAEAVPRSLAGRDIGIEMLSVGINPQELLLDLARGMDEDRRNSSATVEASFAEAEGPPTMPLPDAPAPLEPAASPVPGAGRPQDPEAAVVAAYLRAVQPSAAPSPDANAEGDGSYTMPLPVVLPEPSPPPAERPVAPRPAAAPQRPAAAPEPAAASPPALAEGAGPIRTILLVDDEEDVRRILARWFQEAGYEVVEAEDPEAAVKTGGRLGREGTAFVLVTDLGMPTSGGSSFQGGFEVVKRLWKMNLRPPVLMMTESLSQSLQLRAQQMGIGGFVFKPGLSKLNPRQFEADLRAFAGKIIADVLPKLAAAAPAPRPAKKAAALASEPTHREEPSAAEEELTREFSFLQRRLAELRQPGNANQIAVLVVKVAREFFERGILFLVKNDEARGLGGFGLAPRDERINLLARQVTLSLTEPSPLQEVVQRGKPFVGPLPPGRWSNHLMGRIGRFQAGAVALLPLVAHRETIAVLYGDNPETGREFPRLPALELFVHQAGIALENAFLQRKLQSLQEKG